MRHLSLTDADDIALAYARSLVNTYPRLEGDDGGDGGDDAGDEDGDGGGETGDGDGNTPLQQQALDAIESLRSTGAEIPDALEAAVTELRDARSEAADYRTQLRSVQEEQDNTKKVLDGIAKALGLEGENGDDTDPNELQNALAQKDQENRRLRVLNALGDVLTKHEADPKLTRAVLREDGVLDELDPDEDDFTDKLDAAVKTTVEENPKLRIGQVPSGAADQGARGDTDSKPKDLKSALAAKLGAGA